MDEPGRGVILLVDDSRTIRAVVGEQLRAAGYRPLFAATGEEALAILQHESPSAILLDINLPGMSGLDVCRAIKRAPRTFHIPVIVLTSSSDTEAELNAIRAGADDFISKPTRPRVLDARIQMHVQRTQRERCSNPLTGLPGNVVIEQRMTELFATGEPMAVAYIDLDDFKAFNDRFGYQRGDSVILLAAGIIISAVETAGDEGAFVGHIGGDDFFVLTAPEAMDAVAGQVMAAFDEAVPAFYDDVTRERGWFEAVDRRGSAYRVPIMSISIASVVCDGERFETSLEAGDALAELKHHAKTLPGSVHVKDRRHEAVRVDRPRAADG